MKDRFGRVGITFSTFDLFHAGHVSMLKEASKIMQLNENFRRKLTLGQIINTWSYGNSVGR